MSSIRIYDGDPLSLMAAFDKLKEHMRAVKLSGYVLTEVILLAKSNQHTRNEPHYQEHRSSVLWTWQ